MRIEVRPLREEAIRVGFLSMGDRLTIGYEEWKRILESWKVEAFCDDERVVGMLMTKGPELHVAVLPEVRGKWLSRRLIREVFRPILVEHGRVETKVADGNEIGADFVDRIRAGFANGDFDPITATAAAVGSQAIGGIVSADASKEAARIQAAAGEQAIGEQAREFNVGQAALKPYRDVGQAALFKLSDYLGLSVPGQPATATTDATGSLLKPFSFDISQDPGYQFRLSQGETAVENSAAARGSQLSGATLKELLRYGQDYASGEFNAAFQRDQATKNQVYSTLTGAAGMGANATTTGVQAGQTTAANIGNTITGIGNAQAAGTIGSANAFSNALTGSTGAISQAYLLNQILGKNNPGVTSVNQGVNLPSAGAGDIPPIT